MLYTHISVSIIASFGVSRIIGCILYISIVHEFQFLSVMLASVCVWLLAGKWYFYSVFIMAGSPRSLSDTGSWESGA